MDSTDFAEHITTVHRSLEEMAENIAYVRGELASLNVGNEIRASIRAVCDEFDSALYDVRKEVWTLAPLQGVGGAAAPDPEETSVDPRRTRSLISTWLRRELQRVHELVTSLQSDPALSAAYVLVAESAVNILRAFSRMESELDAIMARPDRADNG